MKPLSAPGKSQVVEIKKYHVVRLGVRGMGEEGAWMIKSSTVSQYVVSALINQNMRAHS